MYIEGLTPGRCPVVRMRRPGRHQPTVQEKLSTQNNICVMTCYYQSQPGVKGYRQRSHTLWKEKGLFQVGEQRLCDQVHMIHKKGWLSQLQLEEIRRLEKCSKNNVEAQQEEQNRTYATGNRMTYSTG